MVQRWALYLRYFPVLTVLVLFQGAGCLVERPSMPTGPAGDTIRVGDTVYVPLEPAWTGFRNPSDVLVGREPFLYVADTDNHRIVMLDLAGRLVGISPPIRRPVALAQDGHFDLLVCAELDTVLPGGRATIGAVFRVKLREAQHDIRRAPIRLAYAEPERPQRRFTAVAVLPDNSYLVARTGPQNTSAIDPDEAVLHVGVDDRLRSPLPTLRPVGVALNAIEGLSGLALSVNGRELVLTQRGQAMHYRVQWLTYATGEASGWRQKFDPTVQSNTLLQPGRFRAPEAAAFDLGGTLYVVDAETDSLYVLSPAGLLVRGYRGEGTYRLRRPSGVTVYNRTLYVADAANGRIVRLRLSTDM
ncbi:MAG: hypothetical protein NZ473_05990 [Candidatus Kapabacteria bacterium]|nr:hypothetical protein [Candidatus Kapabacteria bacterium]MCS7169534.1 hypothetical protein [Candidatus Kapabacteria bacterium]MDW7997099.1 hypothetical protein [Bacteroidota bacterium]